jgi:L-threonylcarbamoyladenylate synthase
MTNSPVVHAEIAEAVTTLANGGIVAFPTDTLYALGADASQPAAVRRVFEIKVREAGKPLPLFVADTAAADRIAIMTPAARKLAERFWPGALTLVLRKMAGFDSEALSGGETVAVRVPANSVALEILAGLGRPVTATSANLSGGRDPVSADEVRRQLYGRIDLLIDAGACDGGVSSTIVDCSGREPKVIRHGAVSDDAVASVLADTPR